MIAGNTNNIGGPSTFPGADAVPVVPHILIAEDQPAIQELLFWTLLLAGYRPTVCAGRQAALTWRDHAMAPGDCPTLLLLDLSLLGVTDAADFLRHLRVRWWDASGELPQIIVLTTSTQMQAELGIRERVLQKPFHVWELLALIRKVISAASRSEEGLWREAEVAQDKS